MKVYFEKARVGGVLYCYPDDGGAPMLSGSGKNKEDAIDSLLRVYNNVWGTRFKREDVKES